MNLRLCIAEICASSIAMSRSVWSAWHCRMASRMIELFARYWGDVNRNSNWSPSFEGWWLSGNCARRGHRDCVLQRTQKLGEPRQFWSFDQWWAQATARWWRWPPLPSWQSFRVCGSYHHWFDQWQLNYHPSWVEIKSCQQIQSALDGTPMFAIGKVTFSWVDSRL